MTIIYKPQSLGVIAGELARHETTCNFLLVCCFHHFLCQWFSNVNMYHKHWQGLWRHRRWGPDFRSFLGSRCRDPALAFLTSSQVTLVLLPWELYLRIITICVHYDIAWPELREPRVMKTLKLHSRRRELHFLALVFFLFVLSQSLSIYKNNFIFQKMLTQLLWEIKYDNPLWIFKIVLKCSAITALWCNIDPSPATLLMQQLINYWWKLSAWDSSSIKHCCHYLHGKVGFTSGLFMARQFERPAQCCPGSGVVCS